MYGNDGGLDVSYDQGETWDFINTMAALGQFYAISADMRKPYYVCGGLQDNGSWCGPSAMRSAVGILNSDWFRVGGGDGFYTQQDPTDWTIVYTESQDGATNRFDLKTGSEVDPTDAAFAPPPTPPAAAAAPRDAQGRGAGAAAHAVRSRRRCRGGRGAGPATSCPSRRRRDLSASSGTRRSCSRRTTRASCTSAATGCSSR